MTPGIRFHSFDVLIFTVVLLGSFNEGFIQKTFNSTSKDTSIDLGCEEGTISVIDVAGQHCGPGDQSFLCKHVTETCNGQVECHTFIGSMYKIIIEDELLTVKYNCIDLKQNGEFIELETNEHKAVIPISCIHTETLGLTIRGRTCQQIGKTEKCHICSDGSYSNINCTISQIQQKCAYNISLDSCHTPTSISGSYLSVSYSCNVAKDFIFMCPQEPMSAYGYNGEIIINGSIGLDCTCHLEGPHNLNVPHASGIEVYLDGTLSNKTGIILSSLTVLSYRIPQTNNSYFYLPYSAQGSESVKVLCYKRSPVLPTTLSVDPITPPHSETGNTLSGVTTGAAPSLIIIVLCITAISVFLWKKRKNDRKSTNGDDVFVQNRDLDTTGLERHIDHLELTKHAVMGENYNDTSPDNGTTLDDSQNIEINENASGST